MHLVRSNAKLVRALAPALLLIAGCTMVGDQMTGTQVERYNATSCVKQCNDTYKLQYREEQKRHIAAVEACKALSNSARRACLNAEEALHEANMDALSQGKTDCQNNCHRQGAGGGS